MSASPRTVAPQSAAHPRIGVLGASGIAFAFLALASWGYIVLSGESGFAELFTIKAWADAGRFVGQLLGLGVQETPAYLRADRWLIALGLAYETLAMSVLAIVFAMVGVLLTFTPAARNLARGDMALSRSRVWQSFYFVVRGVFIVTRAVPELIWAMLLVFIFSPGIIPGALALALHNYGILGKLCAEVVEDMDPRPVRALRSAGARSFQVLTYGILPHALPQFLTYSLYRWEVVIRTTVVVGFVGAGGLGRAFRLHMSWFHYSDVMLLLICYLGLVMMVDLLASWLRRLAR